MELEIEYETNRKWKKMKTRKKIEAGTTLCSLLSTFAILSNRFLEHLPPKNPSHHAFISSITSSIKHLVTAGFCDGNDDGMVGND